MKKLLIAGASVLALSSAAFAADLPPVEPMMPVAAPFSWTGFYIGIHGGGAWGDSDLDGVAIDDFDVEGFVIGAQAGYLWQADWFVFGIEADGSFADLDDDFDDGDIVASVEGDYLASIRGRLGVAFDRFLVYGTGGAAFTGVTFAYDDGDVDADDDTNYFGWVVGGGIEYAITDNVSLGVEYLHYEFDEEIVDLDLVDDPDGAFATDVIRGRLNVKFDSLFN